MNDVIRAERKTHIVLTAVLWINLPMVLYHFFNGVRGAFSMLIILGSLICIAHWWICGFRIKLRDGKLYYRDGLYKVVEIDVEDISSADFEWVDYGYSYKPMPMNRFVIRLKNKQKIVINNQPFSYKEFYELLGPIMTTKKRKRRRKRKPASDSVTDATD